jgi:hypothetical protein
MALIGDTRNPGRGLERAFLNDSTPFEADYYVYQILDIKEFKHQNFDLLSRSIKYL